jgi:uncharacterized protein YuzE
MLSVPIYNPMYKIDFSFEPENESWYIKLNDNHIYRLKKISNHIILEMDEEGVLVGINYLTMGANMPFEVLKKEYGLTLEEEASIKRYFQM